MKFCKDCKWYGWAGNVCHNKRVLDRRDPVSGDRFVHKARVARWEASPCGPGAKLFEPRPTLFQRLASLFR